MSIKINLDASPTRYTFDEYSNEINVFKYRVGHLNAKIRKLKLMRMEVCEHIFELSQIAGDNSVCIKCGYEITEYEHLRLINHNY